MSNFRTVERRVGEIPVALRTSGDPSMPPAIWARDCLPDAERGYQPYAVALDVPWNGAVAGPTGVQCQSDLDDPERAARLRADSVPVSRGGLVALEFYWNRRGFTRITYNGMSSARPTAEYAWKQAEDNEVRDCRLAKLEGVASVPAVYELTFVCPPFNAAGRTLTPTMFGPATTTSTSSTTTSATAAPTTRATATSTTATTTSPPSSTPTPAAADSKSQPPDPSTTSSSPAAVYAGIGAAILFAFALLAVVMYRRGARAAEAKLRDSNPTTHTRGFPPKAVTVPAPPPAALADKDDYVVYLPPAKGGAATVPRDRGETLYLP
ncbi:hypothetical protein H9P43_009127 [Blastocladiella emersonii ATCC 22665]|nr:hypothetical protein H9P43_009127 [Blastocladiella emersonii ATCC 22665]